MVQVPSSLGPPHLGGVKYHAGILKGLELREGRNHAQRKREAAAALRFAAPFVLLCTVKRFALEVLYSFPGMLDFFRDEI